MNSLSISETFPKKSDLKKYLWSNATESLGAFRQHWSYGTFTEPRIGKPGWWPEWYKDPKTPPETMVPMYANPDRIHIIVVGGGSNIFHQVWEFRWPTSVLVDKWR